jgi:uncharacterized protein YjbI with pentapeptide repeats
MIAGARRFVMENDWGVLGVLLVFFAGAVFGSRAAHIDSGVVNWAAWLDSFLQNAGTEMFGAALTFGLIEMLRGARREREAEEKRLREKQEDELRQEEERQERLVLRMGSRVNEDAVRAAEALGVEGWLKDGSLQWAELPEANLQGANLREANLQRADLEGANLQKADLDRANLQGANLRDANLQGADLQRANLKGANLRRAVLEEAELGSANLQGADLTMANLQEAFLRRANLQEAFLSRVNLQGTDLQRANLRGAREITRDQMREARTLKGATLPDGATLPFDDTWSATFAAWAEMVAVDRWGHIVPAR